MTALMITVGQIERVTLSDGCVIKSVHNLYWIFVKKKFSTSGQEVKPQYPLWSTVDTLPLSLFGRITGTKHGSTYSRLSVIWLPAKLGMNAASLTNVNVDRLFPQKKFGLTLGIKPKERQLLLFIHFKTICSCYFLNFRFTPTHTN